MDNDQSDNTDEHSKQIVDAKTFAISSRASPLKLYFCSSSHIRGSHSFKSDPSTEAGGSGPHVSCTHRPSCAVQHTHSPYSQFGAVYPRNHWTTEIAIYSTQRGWAPPETWKLPALLHQNSIKTCKWIQESGSSGRRTAVKQPQRVSMAVHQLSSQSDSVVLLVRKLLGHIFGSSV